MKDTLLYTVIDEIFSDKIYDNINWIGVIYNKTLFLQQLETSFYKHLLWDPAYDETNFYYGPFL